MGDLLVWGGALEPLPPPPERHLAQAEEWLVFGSGQCAAPSVWATAISVAQGWLLLWRGDVPVCVFQPGCWTGAAARYRRDW